MIDSNIQRKLLIFLYNIYINILKLIPSLLAKAITSIPLFQTIPQKSSQFIILKWKMIKFERRSTCKPTTPPSSTPDQPSPPNGSPKTNYASPFHTISAHTTRKLKQQTYCREAKARHRHCWYSSNGIPASTKTNCIIFIKKNKASTSHTTPRKYFQSDPF